MSKELTEKWKNGELKKIQYYVRLENGRICKCLHIGCPNWMRGIDGLDEQVQEVLAPVPSYRDLYGENDGNMPTGVFTILKIIKRDIENAQKRRRLTDLECGIKSQVVSLLKKWGVE